MPKVKELFLPFGIVPGLAYQRLTIFAILLAIMYHLAALFEKQKPRFYWGFKWWPRPGSNRRHTDFQSVALPTELPSHSLQQDGRGAGIRTLDPVIPAELRPHLTCFGARNGTRTRDNHLGKVALYQLSYPRIVKTVCSISYYPCGAQGGIFKKTSGRSRGTAAAVLPAEAPLSGLRHLAGLEAARADAHALRVALAVGHADRAQVRQEAALCYAGRVETDAALVLRRTLADDDVADRGTLSTDVANS